MNKTLSNSKKLLLVFILNSLFASAQTINTNFATQTNATFQNLDKSRIPHKLLVDYGMEFTALSGYNGTLTAENFVHQGNLTEIYNTLLMSRVQTDVLGLVSPITFKNNWDNLRTKNKIVLSGLYFKYNEFKANASPSFITITNNKIYDKYRFGVWQNPYDEKQVFAITTPLIKYNSLTMQVELPSALWYSNQMANLQSVAIDFNDGLGYQTTTFGQIKTVNYTQPGIKEWKYRLTLTNNQVLYSHSKIIIDAEVPLITTNTNTQRTINQPCALNDKGIDQVEFSGTRQYLGKANTATLEIDYANTLGCGTITRPLIIVEGFDSGLLGVENALGENSLRDFYRGAQNATLTLPTQFNTYDVIYVNWNQGKDYLQRNAFLLEDIIKWVNSVKVGGAPNVVRGQSMGGVIARFALRDMENQFTSNPNTPSWQHQTNLYISHDAPHQGANIPLSVAYFARHMVSTFITTPVGGLNINPMSGGPISVSDIEQLIDAPATKQLAGNYINAYLNLDSSVANAWQQELRNMGYPQQTRNIAISNGNHCGLPQQIIPAENIFSFSGNGSTTTLTAFLATFLWPFAVANTSANVGLIATFQNYGSLLSIIPGNSKIDLDFKGYASPLLGQTPLIYKGKITYTKKILGLINVTLTFTNIEKYNPSNLLPIDYYSGGNYDSFLRNGSTNSSSDFANFASYGTAVYARDMFNFITATSALDVGRGSVPLVESDYLRNYNAVNPPTGSKTIPFINFTTSHNNIGLNEKHISFNTRNGVWLATELDNNPNTNDIFDCTDFCSNSEIIGGTLCTTANYTVTTNTGTNFTWSIIQGGNLASLSNANLQIATLTKTGFQSGQLTLQLTFGNNNCGVKTVRKTIWVGLPYSNGQSIIGAYDNVPIGSNSGLYISSPVAGATSYNWQIVPTSLGSGCGCTTDADGLVLYPPSTIFPSFQYGSSGSSVSINWGNCPGTYHVNLFATNECGSAGVQYKSFNVFRATGGGGGGNPCTPQLTVYPNPVKNGIIEASIAYPGDPCNNNLSTLRINENVDIEIYDLQNNKVVSKKFKKNNINISDANLKKGHYILIAKIENEEPIKKIIIVE